DKVCRAGELDGGSLVGQREALRIESSEWAFRVRRITTGGGASLEVDRSSCGGDRGAVVPVQRDVARQVELVGLLQIDASLGLNHQPRTVAEGDIGLGHCQIDPIGSVLLGGGGGDCV